MKFPLDGELFAIQRLGWHEAGHYIIARVLGFETGDLSICFFNSAHCEGSVETEHFQSEFKAQTILEKRIQVLFAGVMAESLAGGVVDEEKAHEEAKKGGRQDRNIASEYICMVRRYRQPTLTDRDKIRELQAAIFKELWDQTRELVERHSEVIIVLGGHLAEKVKQPSRTYVVPNDEVEALPVLREFLNGLSSKVVVSNATFENEKLERDKNMIKDIFDNVRNMLISGSVLYAAKISWQIKSYSTSDVIFESLAFWMLMVIGLALLGLNVYHLFCVSRFHRVFSQSIYVRCFVVLALFSYVSLSISIALSQIKDLPSYLVGTKAVSKPLSISQPGPNYGVKRGTKP